jgi:hypothetical protein
VYIEMTKFAVTREIHTLTSYVEYLEQNCEDDTLLFRGQPEDKPLLPRLARLKLRTGKSILAAEASMFNDFHLRALPYLDIDTEDEWEWLALAQHHGMPTRLLDWTINPMVALWFAVAGPPKDNGHGVVWIFRVEDRDLIEDEDEDPFAGDKTRVFQPRHITPRIIAQSGWFTSHKYLEAGRFIALERNSKYKKRLTKLTVPPSQFSKLRKSLDRNGFNSATLFADLSGLTRHIEWKHARLEDET